MNCVVLDEAKVKFGDNVFIAPNCGFYTAAHPFDVEQRNRGLEYARPITVGDNVWIGANVCVLPGVTIGSNCVIGAGSVVNKIFRKDHWQSEILAGSYGKYNITHKHKEMTKLLLSGLMIAVSFACKGAVFGKDAVVQ